MEAIIGLAILAGGLFFAYLMGQSNGGRKSMQQKSASKPRAPRKQSAHRKSHRPSPFDAASARHLPHERTLTGPAWVTDGDTITIKKTQIRLFGIDAPELDHPYGKQAKWALHKLCKGHAVRAEITDVDHYGRTVARCYLSDGRDLSAEMVKQGLAIDWPKFSGGRYGNLETSDARRKMFLADARQKGRMHVWENFKSKNGNQ